MAERSRLRERFSKYKKADDLGLSSKVGSDDGRALNKDGTFNIERIGGVINVYHWLVSIKWSHFLLLIFGLYMMANFIFATIYVIIGVNHISGISGESWWRDFGHAYFFSAQTLTTVGYGALAPKGFLTSMVASLEAVIGLLSFSLATGLFYGRFARPNKSFIYSNIAVIATGEEHPKLMLRLANKYNHNLLNLEAQVLATMIINDNGNPKRTYQNLKLEVSKVIMLPLNWTLVHVIDQDSPLHEMTALDFEESKVEILVMMKAHDESFGTEVYSRSSWRYDEVIFNARFKTPYYFNEQGKTIFDVSLLDAYEPLLAIEK